jgi:NAD(P)-dependent dehydrogenase (short-subunit alcohol dehydrogenase family)
VLADCPLDLLVANAGTGTRADWRDVDDDAWDRPCR